MDRARLGSNEEIASHLKMSESNNQTIEQKLKDTWRQDRRFCHVRGLSRFLLWAVAMVVIDFIVDWGILAKTGTSAKVAILLPVVNVVVLLWVLWHEWLRHLRPYKPLLVALDVENENPNLSSLLVSYTQLQGEAVASSDISRDLIEAMRSEAVTRARPINFREIIDFGQLKKLLGVTVVIVLFFGIASITWQDHVKTLFQRLAGAEIEYPTQTDVLEITTDFTVRTGGSVEVSAGANETKVVPAAGRVFTRFAEGDGEWKALPLKKDRDGAVYRRELKDLTRDLLYYVELGDDRGETYRIKVVHSPRVVAANLQLTYPDYMKRDAGSSDQLNLEVPAGTTVAWNVSCSPPINKLVVLATGKFPPEEEEDADGEGDGEGDEESDDEDEDFDEDDEEELVERTKEIEAEVAPDGKSFRFTLTADNEIKYSFRWTERASGQNFQFDDVQSTVRVIRDAVPEIELLQPQAGGVATVDKKLEIKVRASDDNGLAKAWLVYSLDGSDEQRIEIHDFLGVPAQEFSYTWDIKKSIPELEPNRRVHVSIELVDLHPNSLEHTRRSVERQIGILGKDDYLQWYLEQLAAQHDEIRRARDAEKTSSERVKELKIQEGEVR